MEEKLNEIFSFLKGNRSYNKIVQENFYDAAITPYEKTEDKVVNLLYDIANTQSQPKIDKLSSFFKQIHKKPDELLTFKGFLNRISENKELTYRNLFESLRIQSGWGNKTAALFTKTIFHLHNGNYRNDLKIWTDTPKNIEESDDFYLPVDAVIIAIFKGIEPNRSWNFDNITKKIKEFYKHEEIEVWDDLWFWGFITQKGSGENRVFEWNENKYWMMKESEKNPNRIKEIKLKANRFIEILNVNQ
ncbi:hypothetical protein [Ancylomarina euxinus]|nr:hypothetical protein [Ancylomarina euxinus]MCZ4694415.1 hypothetical protein [Ancylomarina euxinus]MUP14255.1 hypothetical protein [Ancylomarina euxinus]